MKKTKIISMALAVILAIPCVSAFAEPEPTSEPVVAQATASPEEYVIISFDNSTVSFDNLSSMPTAWGGVLIAAAYNGTAIKKVKTYDITADTASIKLDADFDNGDNLKLMVWDSLSGMKPYSAVKAATIVKPEESAAPSSEPTVNPSASPSSEPTVNPSVSPSSEPTANPSVSPSSEPTVNPSASPSSEPTVNPSVSPSSEPTVNPSVSPSSEPTVNPSVSPSSEPSAEPVTSASPEPTATPTADELLEMEIQSIADNTDLGVEKDESFTGNINVYMNWGTLSPLYSLLNVWTDIDAAKEAGKDPSISYMWFERPATANEALLPDNVSIMNKIDSKYNSGANNAENTKACMGYIKKVYETYPNAHYTLFTDDLRAQYEFLMMNYTGIPHDQYNVVLGTDGTATYSYIKTYLFKGTTPSNVEAAEANNNWGWYEYWYKEYKRRISNHNVEQSRFLATNGGASFVMWAEASQDNVEYWLQWPQLLVSDDEEMTEYLKTKMNLVEKHHNDIYASLSENSKKEFVNCVLAGAFKGVEGYDVNTDYKKMYDETYFPNYSTGGKYMIIAGTSVSGMGSLDAFKARVNAIKEYYGDDYTYLMKPHPNWTTAKVEAQWPGYKAFLEEAGVTELPAQTPMEVIMWIYPNAKVGGYNSSLFMSATGENQFQFLFAANSNNLSAPLPDMFKNGIFGDNVKFFNPTLQNPDPTASPVATVQPAASASPQAVTASASPQPVTAKASPQPVTTTASPQPVTATNSPS